MPVNPDRYPLSQLEQEILDKAEQLGVTEVLLDLQERANLIWSLTGGDDELYIGMLEIMARKAKQLEATKPDLLRAARIDHFEKTATQRIKSELRIATTAEQLQVLLQRARAILAAKQILQLASADPGAIDRKIDTMKLQKHGETGMPLSQVAVTARQFIEDLDLTAEIEPQAGDPDHGSVEE